MPSFQSSNAFIATIGRPAPLATPAGCAPAGLPLRAPWRSRLSAAVLVYLSAVSMAVAAWLLWSQGGGVAQAASLCALPALLAVWLVWRDEPDDRQFLVELMGLALIAPVLLGAWFAGDLPAAYAARLAAVCLHLSALWGAAVWLGANVLSIAAVPSVERLDAGLLHRRLLSLADAGMPAEIRAAGPDPHSGRGAASVVVRIRLPGTGRTHAVTLVLDAGRSRVRVFEASSSPSGALPAWAGAGADMAIGSTWHTTMIGWQRLVILRLTLEAGKASLALPQARALDADGVMTLLCAVITRSGWDGHPGWRA